MATFTHNGRTTGYQMSGSGAPVLLFHGTTQAANAWDQVIQSAQEPRTWVVCEFPGSGESDMPTQPIELDNIVNDAVALMKSLGFDTFHVGGYSLGAVAALRCAALHSREVLTVSSLCGWSRSDARMRATFDLWRRLIAIGPDVFMRYALVDGYTVAALELMEPMIEQVIPMAASMIQPGSDAHLDLDIRVDIEDSLTLISAPCLVMGAIEDRWVDVSHSRHIAATVPKSTLIELPAGHLVIGELAGEIAHHLVRHTA
ncbi:MAG: alpha/beta fold hydrolase [Actinobacteria bacterium]|nr:alpha/beta fold hydrolase [Actinomycetota bacterium]